MHIRNALRSLLLTIALVQFACSNQSEGDAGGLGLNVQDSAVSILPPCPRVVVDTTGWTSDSTRDGRLTLRLPSERSDLSAANQIWVFSFGDLGYRVAESDQQWYDSVSTDPSASERGWCQEQIGGRQTLIQYTYGSMGTGAGYYMQAIWKLDGDEEIRLTGLARDTMHADVLLEIARSVTMREESIIP